MKNTIIKNHNFITGIIASVMALITIVSVGFTSVINAEASDFTPKDVWVEGTINTDDPTCQDTNPRNREIRSFSVAYSYIVTGIKATFSDGTAGKEIGDFSEGYVTTVNLKEGDYITGITYNYNVPNGPRKDTISNLVIYTKNGMVYGPYGAEKGGIAETRYKNFYGPAGSEVRAVGFKASLSTTKNPYLTGIGVMVSEKKNLDKDDNKVAEDKKLQQIYELQKRSERRIKVKIDIGAGYIVKKQEFWGRKITGIDASGNYILGNWEKLLEVGDDDQTLYVTADYVEFGYSFDIKGGTNWPYSGIFRQGSTDEIKSIDITTGGTCRRASLTIKVDGKQVLHHGNCASHKHYKYN